MNAQAFKAAADAAIARRAATKAASIAPAGTRKRAALDMFNNEARKTFPAFDLPRATAAFLATERGAALYRAYRTAAPDIVEPPSASTAKADEPEPLARLKTLAAEIARNDGIDERIAFAKALDTKEGRELHAKSRAEELNP